MMQLDQHTAEFETLHKLIMVTDNVPYWLVDRIITFTRALFDHRQFPAKKQTPAAC